MEAGWHHRPPPALLAQVTIEFELEIAFIIDSIGVRSSITVCTIAQHFINPAKDKSRQSVFCDADLALRCRDESMCADAIMVEAHHLTGPVDSGGSCPKRTRNRDRAIASIIISETLNAGAGLIGTDNSAAVVNA